MSETADPSLRIVMRRRPWPIVHTGRGIHQGNLSCLEYIVSSILTAIMEPIVLGPIRWLRYRIQYKGAWTIAVLADPLLGGRHVMLQEHCPSRADALKRKAELEAQIASGTPVT
jgi:hypothetical protein